MLTEFKPNVKRLRLLAEPLRTGESALMKTRNLALVVEAELHLETDQVFESVRFHLSDEGVSIDVG